MARKYEKVQELLPEVQQLSDQGYTRREIAERMGFTDETVVKNLLYRARHEGQQGIPKQRGRKPAKTLQEYKYENKRLKMEVELLLDFLSLIGKE